MNRGIGQLEQRTRESGHFVSFAAGLFFSKDTEVLMRKKERLQLRLWRTGSTVR